MLERARAAGVRGMIVTGGSLHESQEALVLARAHGEYYTVSIDSDNHLPLTDRCARSYLGLHATVGCHPTRSAEFDKYKGGPEGYLQALDDVLAKNAEGKGPAVAVGECGLGNGYFCWPRKVALRHRIDYDRLHFASQEIQQKHFRE